MTTKNIPLSSRVTFNPVFSCLKAQDKPDVYLTPSERKLLEIILEGKASKENIFEHIWHSRGTIVGESSYHQLIKTLRRKLQRAGLPSTVIKTLPRYGLIYIHPDDNAPSVEEEVDKDDTPSSIVPSLAAEQPKIDAYSPLGLTFEPPVTSLLPVIQDERRENHVHFPRWLTDLSCGIVFLLPLLIQYFWISGESNFANTLESDGITYHATSEQLLSPETLESIAGRPEIGIRHVYLAANGPKIWIAQCRKEIEKEQNQCHYKNMSVY